MNKIIKNQISQLKPSATLAINEESNKLKKSGKKIYKFGFGQSPFPVPEPVVHALKSNANKHTYLPMQGLSDLRQSVAKYTSKKKNYEYNSENVIRALNSAKEIGAKIIDNSLLLSFIILLQIH